MKAPSQRSNASWKRGWKDFLLVVQGGRRMTAVHGDRRRLDWRNHKCKPKRQKTAWLSYSFNKGIRKNVSELACLWYGWEAAAVPQCCGWPPLKQGFETRSCSCSATEQTNSCCDPIGSTLLQSSKQQEMDEDQLEMSESPEPPRHTLVLRRNDDRWLERWSPVGFWSGLWGFFPAMTVEEK